MLLKPHIDIELGVPVWRMEIDETSDTLFLEIRDVPNKQVYFTAIDLNTGNLNFKELRMPERWLSSLEAANNGVMLVSGFQGETIPVHKGLMGIDGKTGEVLWSDYNITFENSVTEGFIVADARLQPKKLFLINVISGQRIPAINFPLNKDLISNINYPHTIAPNDISDGLNKDLYGNEIHYLTHNKFRIVSLHALNQGVLSQHLYVLDEDNNLIFADLIAGGIQKQQPEAFINYKNKLIWLKNRSVVKVLDLYKPL